MCTNCNQTTCSECSQKTFEEVVKIDSKNVLYHSDNLEASKLESIGVGNGSSIEYALEKVIEQVNFSEGLGYPLFDLSCFNDCEVVTSQDFAELISKEICQIKTSLQTINANLLKLTEIDERLKKVEVPVVTDGSLLNISDEDYLKTILDKIIDRYKNLPQFNQSYYKFDLVNSATTSAQITYTNGANQVITVMIPPASTVSITNVKTILTSATSTLTFIFKGF